jgi:hypothetical protein
MVVHLNTDAVKYTLVALSSPFWLPFCKALLKEFNDALRDEGGLLGRAPTKAELVVLNKTLGKFDSPMQSERWEDAARNQRIAREQRRAPRSATKGQIKSASQGPAPRAGGAVPRRGFRTTR